MNILVRDLFVTVVSRKMKEEHKTADEVMTIYPKLTDVEKAEIKEHLADK
jgi:hypothetical protein